jgi:hypothetical protein
VVSQPTPCRAVYTVLTWARGADPTAAVAATYASTTDSGAVSYAARGSSVTSRVSATRWISAAMATSSGETIWDPASVPPRYTLYPLSLGGLCEAVTITPALAPRWRTAKANTGVGSSRGSSTARTPAPAMIDAVSVAKTCELRRPS